MIPPYQRFAPRSSFADSASEPARHRAATQGISVFHFTTMSAPLKLKDSAMHKLPVDRRFLLRLADITPISRLTLCSHYENMPRCASSNEALWSRFGRSIPMHGQAPNRGMQWFAVPDGQLLRK